MKTENCLQYKRLREVEEKVKRNFHLNYVKRINYFLIYLINRERNVHASDELTYIGFQ